MSDLVLDCSVTMSWCFEDEASVTGDHVLEMLANDRGEHRAWVPPIWLLEVANVLLVAERRGRLQADDSARFVDLVGSLPILLMPQLPTLSAQTLVTGRQYNLSSYDACYLQLAMEKGLPLASMDKGLITAAGKAGVEVFKA